MCKNEITVVNFPNVNFVCNDFVYFCKMSRACFTATSNSSIVSSSEWLASNPFWRSFDLKSPCRRFNVSFKLFNLLITVLFLIIFLPFALFDANFHTATETSNCSSPNWFLSKTVHTTRRKSTDESNAMRLSTLNVKFRRISSARRRFLDDELLSAKLQSRFKCLRKIPMILMMYVIKKDEIVRNVFYMLHLRFFAEVWISCKYFINSQPIVCELWPWFLISCYMRMKSWQCMKHSHLNENLK